MRTIEKEIKKTIGFEAIDGTVFHITSVTTEEQAKEECKKYEETANAVIVRKVKDFQIAEGSNYDLDPMNMNDDMVQIFKPENQNQLDALNQYLKLKCRKNVERHLNESYIGKEVIIQWNYDMDWAITYTYEEFLDYFKTHFYKMIEEYKENKNANKEN